MGRGKTGWDRVGRGCSLYINAKGKKATILRYNFCHTRAQLIISAHLISISDDKLGPRSGIIISMEPAGRPTTGIVEINHIRPKLFVYKGIQISNSLLM